MNNKTVPFTIIDYYDNFDPSIDIENYTRIKLKLSWEELLKNSILLEVINE